jgi:hypothetical protein
MRLDTTSSIPRKNANAGDLPPATFINRDILWPRGQVPRLVRNLTARHFVVLLQYLEGLH